MRILFLYSEVMGYTVATIRALSASGAEVHVVRWDRKRLTPYALPEIPGTFFYERSSLDFWSLRALTERINPAITVVSGWMDNAYTLLARHLKSLGRVVVVGLDNRWDGTFKQHLASFFSPTRIIEHFYSHAWVAGVEQFEYARRLGFRKQQIVFDMYSADLSLFRSVVEAGRERRRVAYPRRFLFVGRLDPIKGLDTLVQAWRLIEDRRFGWELQLVGHGGLRDALRSVPGIIVTDFLQPQELVSEMANAGCFVLPSRDEHWGVVVHECAATGLPLILSDAVGAGSSFLIPGMNGYRFPAGDAVALADAMTKIMSRSVEDLLEMGSGSEALASRITPETSARNLLGIARDVGSGLQR